MYCTNCGREINLDNLVLAPVVSPREKLLIDNISIYSADCIMNDCQHHIHMMIEDDFDTLPKDNMNLETYLIEQGLATEEPPKVEVLEHFKQYKRFLGKTRLVYEKDFDDKQTWYTYDQQGKQTAHKTDPNYEEYDRDY